MLFRRLAVSALFAIATFLSGTANLEAWIAQKAVQSGTTYYLTAAGSDTNNGTSATACDAGCGPWKTIAAITAHTGYQPGDKFLFNGGETFAGNIYLDNTKATTSALSPITVSSYGTGVATINAGNGNALYLYNLGGVDIKNINFVGAGATVNNGEGIIAANDAPGLHLAHLVIDNIEVSGFGGRVSGGTFNGNGRGIIIYTNTTTSTWQDISITRTKSHDNSTTGIETWAPLVTLLTNVYIGQSQAYNNLGIAGSNGNIGSGIVLSGVTGGTIEYSVAYNNGKNNTATEGPYGIWAYAADQIIVQFNESYSNHTNGTNDGGGFDADGGTTNSIYQYNYAHDNDGSGFLINQYSTTKTNNNTIRYNVSENNCQKYTGGDIEFHSNPGNAANLSGNKIYNNTIYKSGGAAAARAIYGWDGGSTNTSVRNNIIQTAGGKTLIETAGTQTGLAIQGNDYWSSNGTFAIVYGGTTYSSLAALQSGTGQEKNPLSTGTATGMSADPLLVAPGSGGTIAPAALTTMTAYQLQASSTLRNAGLNLPALFSISVGSRDFWGNAIPVDGAYDIGAFDGGIRRSWGHHTICSKSYAKPDRRGARRQCVRPWAG